MYSCTHARTYIYTYHVRTYQTDIQTDKTDRQVDETRHKKVEREHRAVTLLRQGILDNVQIISEFIPPISINSWWEHLALTQNT